MMKNPRKLSGPAKRRKMKRWWSWRWRERGRKDANFRKSIEP